MCVRQTLWTGGRRSRRAAAVAKLHGACARAKALPDHRADAEQRSYTEDSGTIKENVCAANARQDGRYGEERRADPEPSRTIVRALGVLPNHDASLVEGVPDQTFKYHRLRSIAPARRAGPAKCPDRREGALRASAESGRFRRIDVAIFGRSWFLATMSRSLHAPAYTGQHLVLRHGQSGLDQS